MHKHKSSSSIKICLFYVLSVCANLFVALVVRKALCLKVRWFKILLIQLLVISDCGFVEIRKGSFAHRGKLKFFTTILRPASKVFSLTKCAFSNVFNMFFNFLQGNVMKKLYAKLVDGKIHFFHLSYQLLVVKSFPIIFTFFTVLSSVSPVNSNAAVGSESIGVSASKKDLVSGNNSTTLDFIAAAGTKGIKKHKIDEKDEGLGTSVLENKQYLVLGNRSAILDPAAIIGAKGAQAHNINVKSGFFSVSASAFQQAVNGQRFDPIVAKEAIFAPNAVHADVYSTAINASNLNLLDNSINSRALAPQTFTILGIKGIVGYDPFTNQMSTRTNIVWKNTGGVFTAGRTDKGITRQVVGVAAGREDTDAVNVAQLKALREKVLQIENGSSVGWNLLVGGVARTVRSGDAVNLISSDDNLKIIRTIASDGTSQKSDITFALSRDLKLNTVLFGSNALLSVNGLMLSGGPSVTMVGIDAGNSRITKVAAGKENTDAVNVKQLNERLGEIEVARDLLVKQDSKTKHITIGVETFGDEVNISNKNGENRTLSGVKEAMNDNEAVNKAQLDKSFTSLSGKIQDLGSAAVLYNKKSDGNIDYTSVTLGKDKNSSPVALHNVANGSISSKSHDAITGSQLDSLGNEIAASFGGTAKYKNGQWLVPSFKIKNFDSDGDYTEESYQNVSAAFDGVNNSFKSLNDQIAEVRDSMLVTQGGGKYSDANVALGDIRKEASPIYIGKAVGGTEVVFLNNEGKSRKLSGVGAAENDNDAVNKGQLDSSIKDVNDKLTNKVNEFDEKITNLVEQVKGDTLSWSEVDKAYVARHGKGESRSNSKITFLANGLIGKDSTDAITGGQLYTLNQTLATYFGGGAKYEDGKWT
ncbi:hypothetical protein Q653_00860, partial [Bartonella henselae JK 42]